MPDLKVDSTGRRNTLIMEVCGGTRWEADIGSVGDAYDNAAAETVMGMYKNEAIAKNSPFHIGPLKTLADVEKLTFDWLDWYNNQRLHSALGYMPPAEYETNCGSPDSSVGVFGVP